MSIGPLLYSPDTDRVASKASSGPKTGGGEEAPSPANHGLLAPRSSVQLAPPRLPDNANHLLPIAATILDAQAPAIIAPQSNLGLPWMPDNTNSAGPGSDGGIGAGKEGGMGDREGSGGGEGESNLAHSRGVSPPVCVVCPYPIYTDEARHAKMQGTVTLRVLSDPRERPRKFERSEALALDWTSGRRKLSAAGNSIRRAMQISAGLRRGLRLRHSFDFFERCET